VRRVEPPPEELLHHPRYELLEQVGAGSMGVVYRARHRFMDRIVALKVVRRSLLHGPEMAARFEREVQGAACLLHPNIVTAFDAETSGTVHFLVLEYVPGQNLADLIQARGPLAVDRACDYARQAALGLQQAYLQGTVHRDIKPHNLILAAPTTPGGPEVVKILDFGLTRFVQEGQPRSAEDSLPGPDLPLEEEATALGTYPGTLMGTVNYMAPEQASDPHQADIRADIYSLGCTLYHFLAGRPPFADGTIPQKLQAHLRAAPPPLTARRSDIPAELDAVVQRMLAKAPSQRYQTPAEVAQALAPFANVPSPSPRTAGPAPPPARQNRRRGARLLRVIAGVLVLAFLVVALYPGFLSSGRVPEPSDDRGLALVTQASVVLEGHTGPVLAIAYGPDGNLLLSGSTDGTVRLWNLGTASPLQVFHGHKDGVRSVAVSPDGKLAISGSKDGTVRLWDLHTGQQQHCCKHDKTVTSVAFSPGGRQALSGSEDGTICRWEVATARRVRCFRQPAECLAFAPDGRHCVSGWWDNQLSLWNVEQPQERRVLLGHERGIKSVAFSPDGQRIVSASEDRTLILWDAQTGKALRRWQAHKGLIWGAAFSPDGRRILSVGWDCVARLWDAETADELQRFAPDAEELVCAAISPEGRQGACGSADRLIRLWTLPR
jgi:serine/threonine protein kinase